jgi:flagellar L-ring protein precursor FlgH
MKNSLLSRYYNLLLIIILSLNLLGCGHQYVPRPDDPSFAPVIPDIAAVPQSSNGSAYVDGYGLSLYQDMKAYRVGDILTVKLKEETKASKDAKTNFKKSNSLQMDQPTILGNNNIRANIANLLPFVNSNTASTLQSILNSESEFKGAGDGSQNNSLSGDITVTISQVLPNKNLVIRGEKWLTLNQGAEYIRLSGIVRPQDIGPNNEVSSARIANARITYSGTGPVADSNKQGWLAKFFNSYAPF